MSLHPLKLSHTCVSVMISTMLLAGALHEIVQVLAACTPGRRLQEAFGIMTDSPLLSYCSGSQHQAQGMHRISSDVSANLLIYPGSDTYFRALAALAHCARSSKVCVLLVPHDICCQLQSRQGMIRPLQKAEDMSSANQAQHVLLHWISNLTLICVDRLLTQHMSTSS